ncbi:MAG TPA: phage tail protein [Fibrobacteria bacterium]|nr:phage tail protein [Fibrobacteria bacterium]
MIRPFSAFNFLVEIVPSGARQALVAGSFAECDGLEMNMEIKTIREGGGNDRQIRLAGPSTWGQLTLRRGMSGDSRQLWRWMADSLADPGLRAEVEVVVVSSDHQTENVRFLLSRCLPVKLKAPALNAKDGAIAVEELQIAYERFDIRFPEAGT